MVLNEQHSTKKSSVRLTKTNLTQSVKFMLIVSLNLGIKYFSRILEFSWDQILLHFFANLFLYVMAIHGLRK